MSTKTKEIVSIVIGIILMSLLSNLFYGCSTYRKHPGGNRKLSGRKLYDDSTGRIIQPEHIEGNKFWLHEVTPSGEVIYFKDEEK